jgi:hypothetical protein
MKKLVESKKKKENNNYPCRVAVTKEAHEYLKKIAGERGGKSFIASRAILMFR